MSLTEAYEAIDRVLEATDRILITTHVNPDGDAVGSVLALRGILRALGKRAEIVMDDALPPKYRFLSDGRIYRTDDADFARIASTEPFQLAVFVDASEPERAGAIFERLNEWLETDAPVVNIDHHVGNTGFGDIVAVDWTRASSAELVMEVAAALGVPLSPTIATQLFTAVLTDTGRFQFSNTTPESLHAAGELVAAGADPPTVTERIYHQRPAAFYRLIGRVFSGLEIHHEGRLCIMVLPEELVEEFFPGGAIDTEGIVDFTVQIEGVQLGVFIRQVGARAYRASFRSRGSIDVRPVAEKFGGGGHEKAAGCLIEGSFEEVRQKIIAEIERCLD